MSNASASLSGGHINPENASFVPFLATLLADECRHPDEAALVEGAQRKVVIGYLTEAYRDRFHRSVLVLFDGFPERVRFGFESFEP